MVTDGHTSRGIKFILRTLIPCLTTCSARLNSLAKVPPLEWPHWGLGTNMGIWDITEHWRVNSSKPDYVFFYETYRIFRVIEWGQSCRGDRVISLLIFDEIPVLNLSVSSFVLCCHSYAWSAHQPKRGGSWEVFASFHYIQAVDQ